MSKFNKNVPFKGNQRGSTIRGRVSKFSSAPKIPVPSNSDRYRQPSATSSNYVQNNVLGKGKSVTRQTAVQNHFHPPHLTSSNQNSSIIGRNTYYDTSDETSWDEDNFDVDDPMIATQSQQQQFYGTNKRFGQFAPPHSYQGINLKMLPSSSENFYNCMTISNKRRPLVEIQSRQDRQNQAYYGHNPAETWTNKKNHCNLYSVASTSRDTTNMYGGIDDDWLTEMIPIQNTAAKRLTEIDNRMEREGSLDISTQLQSNSRESKISESNFPRIFTVSISKLLSWNKHNIPGEIIFEVFGILDVVKINKCIGVQNFTLKGQQKGRIECTFRSIDRKLAIGHTGQWHRCIGLLKKNGEFQCLSLRPATQGELASMDCILPANSKVLAQLFRQY